MRVRAHSFIDTFLLGRFLVGLPHYVLVQDFSVSRERFVYGVKGDSALWHSAGVSW